MASFCKQCTLELFGDYPPDIFAEEPGTITWDLCEGCGWGFFDENGFRVDSKKELKNEGDST